MNRSTYSWILVALVGLLAAGPATAGVVEIQFTGVDLVYDGTDIFDATAYAGGNGDPLDADPLTTMVFLLDGNVQGILKTPPDSTFLDCLFLGITIPIGGGVVTSTGNGDDFGLDLLTSAAGLEGLALDVDQVEVYYNAVETAVAISGVANVVAATNLPFGLVVDLNEAVTFVLSSSNLMNVTDDGQVLTGFTASGTGSVTLSGTPEPATLALLGLGAAGALLARRRRR